MLHPFKQHELDQESKDIRRLMWILEVKRIASPFGKLRKEYNAKKDKQIIILIKLGMSMRDIFEKVKTYGYFIEMAGSED